MNDLKWPKDYVERKLAIFARLDSLDGEGGDCANKLWELLLEAEVVADKFKTAAAEAEWAVYSFRGAVTGLVEALQKIDRKRRPRSR